MYVCIILKESVRCLFVVVVFGLQEPYALSHHHIIWVLSRKRVELILSHREGLNHVHVKKVFAIFFDFEWVKSLKSAHSIPDIA